MDVNATLDRAIAAAREGRRAEARRLLESVLDADERNEQAWLWLSSVLDDEEDRAICLENVLTLNPANEAARRGLAALRAASTPAPPPATAVAGGQAPARRTAAPARGPTRDDRRVFIVITLALIVLLLCIVAGILVVVGFSPLA